MEQYIEEHIESAIWAVFACADFYLVPNHIPTVDITWYIWYLEREKANNLDKYSGYLFSSTGFKKIYFGQKLVSRSYFRGHKLFVNFEHIFWIFHRPRLSLV